MTIPEDNKEEIIKGMLEFLDPEAMEIIEEIKQVPGRDLINLHGLYRTQDGGQILPGIIYAVSTTERRKLNHRQRIGQIIADSSNMQEVVERLGLYLSKYAKDPNEVLLSIPPYLSIKTIRQN
jgi:hypothetical protein